MIPKTLARRLATMGAITAMLAVALPQVAFGADATTTAKSSTPPRNLTVTITDSGFSAKTYTGGTSGGPDLNAGTVTFKNTGTKVHTATIVPGTSNIANASYINSTDSSGNELPCRQGQKRCGTWGPIDTGGIDAGGSVTFAITGAGTYQLTSATDCLNGLTSTTFDCTPATLKEVVIPSLGPLSSSYPGSVFGTPGSPDCIRTLPVGNGSNPVCVTKVRGNQTLKGSPKAPLDGATVTIDDVTGFQPTIVYIKAGTTVTWVNKGTRVHSVFHAGGPSYQFGSNLEQTLDPGASTTFMFGCNIGNDNTCTGYGEKYQSQVVADLILPAESGLFETVHCKKGQSCGTPGMIGQIQVVPNS